MPQDWGARSRDPHSVYLAVWACGRASRKQSLRRSMWTLWKTRWKTQGQGGGETTENYAYTLPWPTRGVCSCWQPRNTRLQHTPASLTWCHKRDRKHFWDGTIKRKPVCSAGSWINCGQARRRRSHHLISYCLTKWQTRPRKPPTQQTTLQVSITRGRKLTETRTACSRGWDGFGGSSVGKDDGRVQAVRTDVWKCSTELHGYLRTCGNAPLSSMDIYKKRMLAGKEHFGLCSLFSLEPTWKTRDVKSELYPLLPCLK